MMKMEKLTRLLKKQFSWLDARYLSKLLVAGALVGVIAGLGSIAFYSALKWATELFLGQGVGFIPPAPASEGATVVETISRRWMIPVITTVGGFISGLLVYKLAPEAEGHGTDAAIESFHHNEGLIRTRIPVLKLVASAVTIGSGGSAGREGPTAQIAAGFGSLVGRVFKLSTHERRILVAAGIGAGIGSIFKAPLGGAVLSMEILYLEGFEVEALVPSLVASTIGYTLYSTWAGFTIIFGSEFSATFQDPYSLGFYAALGTMCGLIGILYPRCMYRLRDYFRSWNIPNSLKPAIGGLGVGIIGLFLPQVLGMGYGWIQLVMQPQISIPLGIMVLLIFAKIAATSLTIASGGSGGVFAPGLFIGAMIGAAFWAGLHGAVGHVPPTPEGFVVVGMMALFGGVAHAPLAVMLMVADMTASHTMLAPAMIAVGISYFIVGQTTIYESQLPSPALSPAHGGRYSIPVLRRLRVKDAMRTDIAPITREHTIEQAQERFDEQDVKSLPVLDSSTGTLAGVICYEDILRSLGRNDISIESCMSSNVKTLNINDSLDKAMKLLGEENADCLPVVEQTENGPKLVGIVRPCDIARVYEEVANHMSKGNGGK